MITAVMFAHWRLRASETIILKVVSTTDATISEEIC